MLWRSKVFQWLSESKGYQVFNLDSCLNDLQRNPLSCEAAFAAFWYVYLADEIPFSLNENQLERIQRLLEQASLHNCCSDDLRALAFVKLHLACLIAVNLINPHVPSLETPSATTAIEQALGAYELSGPPEIDIDDPPGLGKKLINNDLFAFSLLLLGGIIKVEAALNIAEQRNWEQALYLMADGARHISATTIQLDNDALEETVYFKPYLPHSMKPFDIQEAANIFEEAKSHSKDITNWIIIKVSCLMLNYLGTFDLYDYFGVWIKANDGFEYAASEYWATAITFSEVHESIISSSTYVLTTDTVTRAKTKERLKRDFFPDLWDQMDPKSGDILVEAEMQWEYGRADNILKELRQLLEIELANIFPLLESTTRQTDSRLILTRMKKELSSNQLVQASINSIKMSNHYKSWVLKDLPKFLGNLIDVRNYFEKEVHLSEQNDQKHSNMKKRAENIHRELLGIGCEGILPRLMEIKKVTQGNIDR